MLEDAVLYQTLTQQVVNKLGEYISSRGLKPGDRLPAECGMAEALGVSRPTVREALKCLEAIGVLSRRTGRRTILQDVNLRTLVEPMYPFLMRSKDDLKELSFARQVHEVSILDLVARNIGEREFEQMERANRLIESEINAGCVPIDGDAAFHEALMAATGNKFLSQFGALIQEFFTRIAPITHFDEEDCRRGVREHRQIAAFLREGDIESARKILRDHLSRCLDQRTCDFDSELSRD